VRTLSPPEDAKCCLINDGGTYEFGQMALKRVMPKMVIGYKVESRSGDPVGYLHVSGAFARFHSTFTPVLSYPSGFSAEAQSLGP
jgi:hypothetical protein